MAFGSCVRGKTASLANSQGKDRSFLIEERNSENRQRREREPEGGGI